MIKWPWINFPSKFKAKAFDDNKRIKKKRILNI